MERRPSAAPLRELPITGNLIAEKHDSLIVRQLIPVTQQLRAPLALLLISSLPAFAQNAAPLADLQRALASIWVGTLEYRDYSEPATSTKRVKLPTWLTVEPTGTDLRFRYTYDDGPSKTVTETELVRIDFASQLSPRPHDGPFPPATADATGR